MIFKTFVFIYLTQILTPATRRRDNKKFIFSLRLLGTFLRLESRPSTMKFLVFLASLPSLKNRVKSEAAWVRRKESQNHVFLYHCLMNVITL